VTPWSDWQAETLPALGPSDKIVVNLPECERADWWAGGLSRDPQVCRVAVKVRAAPRHETTWNEERRVDE
jgi:hypothetical protein